MHFLRLLRLGQIDKNTKTTIGHHFTPARMTVVRKWILVSVGESGRKLEPSCIAGRNVKIIQML